MINKIIFASILVLSTAVRATPICATLLDPEFNEQLDSIKSRFMTNFKYQMGTSKELALYRLEVLRRQTLARPSNPLLDRSFAQDITLALRQSGFNDLEIFFLNKEHFVRSQERINTLARTRLAEDPLAATSMKEPEQKQILRKVLETPNEYLDLWFGGSKTYTPQAGRDRTERLRPYLEYITLDLQTDQRATVAQAQKSLDSQLGNVIFLGKDSAAQKKLMLRFTRDTIVSLKAKYKNKPQERLVL